MLLYKDIIKEDDNRLLQKSLDVPIPLNNEDIKLLNDLNQYLENGYDDDFVQKNDIRPGVGLASVQIGVLKRIFVLYAYNEEGMLYHFGVVNPKIISESTELTFLPTGEGCLSVDRETEGLVHRPKRIVARFHLYDFEKQTLTEVKMKFENYIAIVFQHEYDHLNGVLFVDRIDKFDPFHIPDNSHPVTFKEFDLEGN
ncbi:MAG: peptide deformylase [Bacilli bacterium]|nr:peptide deformylase [Bacilli bacterium]